MRRTHSVAPCPCLLLLRSRCLSLAAAVLYQSSVEGIFTPSCQPGAHRGVPGEISPMVWGVRCAAAAVRVARQSFVEVASECAYLAPPSPPRHSTPLWPQVVILDFLDTFSSISRRWRHQFLLSLSFVLSDFRRAMCVAVGTGVGATCRGARRALFCVDSDVCLVKLLLYQAHTGLIHTLGCRGQFTRPRNVVHTTPWKSTHH